MLKYETKKTKKNPEHVEYTFFKHNLTLLTNKQITLLSPPCSFNVLTSIAQSWTLENENEAWNKWSLGWNKLM